MDFDSQLASFQKWIGTESPELSNMVSGIIAANYVSQLGDAATPTILTGTPAQNTVSKIGALIDSVGGTYLRSVEAYYTAKGRVADLKLAAKGSAVTQAVNTAQGAIGIPPSNMLLYGGLALGALLLFSRR